MKTLIQLFEENVEKFHDNNLLLEKTGDQYVAMTFAQTRERVYRMAAGLMSMGISKGDRIALLSEGRNDWVVSELAILYTGAINVPLSVKLTETSDLRFRLSHSGTRMIIVSRNQLAKVIPLKDELSELEKVIILDDVSKEHPKDILLEEVLTLGDAFLAGKRSLLIERMQSIQPNDIANICYTSGTTADPKGIMLSHRNYTANVEQSLSLMDVFPWYTTLLILPWDHAFAHTCGIYTLMSAGGSLAAVQSG
ncbi:MAG TPA: AMP-binding protein, partial [Bacteroidales bacterium]|nr:AMP-binding protein [Bacteroidales bacterium]